MSRIDDLLEFYINNSAVEWRPLYSIARRQKGFSVTARLINEQKSNKDGILVFGAGNTKAYFNPKLVPENRIVKKQCIIVKSRGYIDFQYCNIPCAHKSELWSYTCDSPLISTKFLYYFLKTLTESLQNHARATSVKIPQLSVGDTDSLMIPVPPLEVQEEIVRILDSFTKLEAELEAELEARRKQYEYYRYSLLSLENLTNRLGKEHVKLTPLGEIGAVKMCKRILKNQTAKVGEIPFYKIGTFGKEPNAFIDFNTYEKLKKKYPFPIKGNILISASGTIGNTVIYDGKPAYFQDSNIVWLEHNESIVLDKYLYYVYQMNPWVVPEGGTIKRLYNDIILKTKIPVPPLEEQERIVAILDKFDALVNDLSSGLPAEIAARRKQYEYYRDQLLTFTPAK